MRKTKTNQYWNADVEKLTVQLNQSSNPKEQNRIYNKVRPEIIRMISTLMYQRGLRNDVENYMVDLETHSFLVLTNKSFDPAKSKMYTYLCSSIHHEISAIFKKYYKKQQPLISVHTCSDDEEEDLLFSFTDPIRNKPYHEIIDILEHRLLLMVPYMFPERKKDRILILNTLLVMIEVFRENQIDRVQEFRKKVCERLPETNRNLVCKLTKFLRDEYQYIKNRS